MVAITGEEPLLVAVNEAILPVPLAARPMVALSFVQLYEVAVPVKFTAVVGAPSQTVWSVGSATVGVGFTVTVAVPEILFEHPGVPS